MPKLNNYIKQLKAAIRYYQNWKLSVIPLALKGKKPLVAWEKYQKRLPDAGEIGDWWEKYWSKGANIGIICGKSSGNLVALDFDDKAYYQDFIKSNLEHGKDILKGTLVVQTGKGFHVYLRTKCIVKSFKLESVEVKSQGSYVVGPPSIHNTGKQYHFVNLNVDTIIELDNLSAVGIKPKPITKDTKKDASWVTKALKGVPEGERDNTCVKLAGHYKAKGLDSTETLMILKNWAIKCEPPFPDADVEKCVNSSFSYETHKPSPYLVDRETYLKTISEWLYFEDTEALDIVMATAISICLPGDPVWLFIIAPPGGTKTELLRAFNGKYIKTTSSITPQTLISGLKGAKNVDLLPELNDKVLIIKDFTSILSKKSEDQSAIFSDLREAYDGYLEKSFGSGVGTKSYKSRFGIIAGVTGAIDMYRKVHSLLGERFLKLRLLTDEEAAINKAGQVAGQEKEMRIALSNITKKCFDYYAVCIKENSSIPIDNQVMSKVKVLGSITAKLRSEVARDRMHNVQYLPVPEVGTRLTKQLIILAKSLGVFGGHTSVGEWEYQRLIRVAFDTIPRQRVALVSAMFGEDVNNTKYLGDKAGIPTGTANELLEDLWMLKIVDRSKDGEHLWGLKKFAKKQLDESGLHEWCQKWLV